MNYNEHFKEHLQLPHKIHGKEIQVAINSLSVFSFILVKIEISFTIRFISCTEFEMLSIRNKYHMKKVQVKYIFPLIYY